MHTRQIGAAHINIFYFLIILVLFFGATFFGYLQLTKNTDLETRNAELVQENARHVIDNLFFTHYAEDIGAAVQTLGTYEGRANRRGDYRTGDDPNAPGYYERTSIENVVAIAAFQDAIRTFSSRVGVPEAQGLPEFLNRIGNTYDAQTKRIADSQTQLQTLQSEKAAADASFATATQTQAQTERDLSNRVSTQRDDYEAQLAAKDVTLQTLTDNVQQLRVQLQTEQEDRVSQVRDLTDQMNRIQAQNDAMRQKYALINPPQAPDGRVITANARLGVAIIDLGRKDMLQPGTVFQILDPDRAGVVKAVGTVTSVSDEQSELSISNVADQFRPVTTGDLIANELYSPDIRRNIYLMGRFGFPFSKDSVKALLERLGNTVVDEIRPGVDLVVIGNELIDEESGTMIPLDETPEYRQVLNLSIEVAPLSRLHDLLQFDDR